MSEFTNIFEMTQNCAANFECEDLNIRLMELAGFASAISSLRLPFKKDVRSSGSASAILDDATDDPTCANVPFALSLSSTTIFNDKDITLLSTLVKRGDEHSKCIRGIMVYLEISAPMYFWKQMDTYRFGTDRLASESTMHVDCAGLADDALEEAQKSVSGGYIQKRTQVFSYQTLRRIYFQRKKDRLRIWRDFCAFIETLPFAAEWITVKPEFYDYKD